MKKKKKRNKKKQKKKKKKKKKKTLEGINSRIHEAEKQISELGDRLVKITDVEYNKEFLKNEKK